jgi:hypothetical protein
LRGKPLPHYRALTNALDLFAQVCMEMKFTVGQSLVVTY